MTNIWRERASVRRMISGAFYPAEIARPIRRMHGESGRRTTGGERPASVDDVRVRTSSA